MPKLLAIPRCIRRSSAMTSRHLRYLTSTASGADTQRLPSYLSGVASAPLSGFTIGGAFDKTVRAFPTATALVCPSEHVHMSFSEFAHTVDRLAAALLMLGLSKGARVAVWALSGSEWAATQFATAKAGLILVCCNPGYAAPEILYALQKVECAALITSASFKTSHYDAILRRVLPELDSCAPGALHAAAAPALRHVITLGPTRLVAPEGSRSGLAAHGARHPSVSHSYAGMHRWHDLLQSPSVSDVAAMQRLSAELDCDEPINIQFTSGTTGAPKATTLSHHNVVNNAAIVGGNIRLCQDDAICLNPPLYHCFGQVMGTLAAAIAGAAVLIPGPVFDAGAALRVCASEGATAVYGVPTMWIAMLNNADEPRLRAAISGRLRTGVMAGSVCPVELIRQAEAQWGLRQLVCCYGMTETSPVSVQTSPDDPEWARTETVGRAVAHTEVKLVDAAGRTVPRGTVGELCTRGYGVMRGGYWRDPDMTREAVDGGGWMHTGDLGTADDAGYIRIVGRSKDMIIRGGENVFPKEVEGPLYEHPAVSDVCVFGVKDTKMGEEVACNVILKAGYAHSGTDDGSHVTAADIRAFCKGRMAHYKVPKHVQFVASFPQTASGKVQKVSWPSACQKRAPRS